MKKNTTWLANAFDWIGETFERFNPSAFRFLAAVLPYLTPFPVAWITAHSASDFLNFTPEVAFIFVFALEGIGLWFTSLLVDAVVDWIRSRNWKTGFLVILFAGVVGIYVNILVTLNVTLEASVGNNNPSLSKVITLLCYLPLLTGVGNGYYKMKLENRRDMEISKQEQMELEEKIRQEKRQDRMELKRLKYGNSSRSDSEVPNQFRNYNGTSRSTSESMGRPSIHQDEVFRLMERHYSETGLVLEFKEVQTQLGLPQSTASRLRNKWIESKQEFRQ